MSAITKETVEHYAKLASLSFSDHEAVKMTEDMGKILDYVAKISELDLKDVEATTQVLDGVKPAREDQAEAGLGQAGAMANAPDSERGHFLVPKVIGKR